MTDGALAASLSVLDDEEAVELFHRNGWTDGLPIIAPTPARLARFLDAIGRGADEEIGNYALRSRPVTVGKVALNAIMAGCLPQHLSVVIAIVECMLEPGFNIHTANSSTGSLALGFIVNGPIRTALNMNCHGDVLGPGNRANASIGRAIRLIQLNIMGSISGAGADHAHGLPILDRSTMGQPAKYNCYHIAENEEAFPSLPPLHVQRGFAATDSVVTAFTVAGHTMLSSHAEQTPDAWLDTLAHYLLGVGRLAEDGYGVLLLPPEAAAMFVEAGWSKSNIAQGLFDRTRRSLAWNKTNGWKVGGRYQRGGEVEPGDYRAMLGMVGRPEDLLIAVCGGPAGNFPVFLYTYAASFEAVSRKIRWTPPTQQGSIAPIADALSSFRAMMETDSYGLEVASFDGARLQLVITAGPDACADCLVPKPMMERHVRAALEGKPEWAKLSIDLRYPADQA